MARRRPLAAGAAKGTVLTIHPKDAAARNLKRDDRVVLKTAYGQIEVKVKPTVMVKPGVVGMMHGWAKANVNELIPRQFDPISGFRHTRKPFAKSSRIGGETMANYGMVVDLNRCTVA
jgi:anaerobic selenocysteine-containing dehydrogenase